MTPLAEVLQKPKPLKRSGFDRADTRVLLQIPRYDRSEALIDQLMVRHTALARCEAQRIWNKYAQYAGGVLDFDDVFSAALYGLYVGIKRFDEHYCNEFSTYALHWIRQTAMREVENNLGQARIPVHFQEKIHKSWREQMSGGKANAAVESVQRQLLSRTSLDEVIGEDGLTLMDSITSRASFNVSRLPSPDSPETVVLREALRRRIENSFYEIKGERNRNLLRMRLGINEYDETHTLEEVGEHFGITRERVRQVEAKYMKRMKEKRRFDEDDLAVFGGR